MGIFRPYGLRALARCAFAWLRRAGGALQQWLVRLQQTAPPPCSQQGLGLLSCRVLADNYPAAAPARMAFPMMGRGGTGTVVTTKLDIFIEARRLPGWAQVARRHYRLMTTAAAGAWAQRHHPSTAPLPLSGPAGANCTITDGTGIIQRNVCLPVIHSLSGRRYGSPVTATERIAACNRDIAALADYLKV